jgi:hypothetical protein
MSAKAKVKGVSINLRYGKGEEVWYMENNCAKNNYVLGYTLTDGNIGRSSYPEKERVIYHLGPKGEKVESVTTIEGEKVFATKEELLKSL